MTTSPFLHAISPIDGRYYTQTQALSAYFSEAALIKYRVQVEIEYFIALCDLGIGNLNKISKDMFPQLRKIYEEFTDKDALEIKEIEKTTNHDVKAVEYFIKKNFDALNLNDYKEFIHFGLTSQDINNTAQPLMLKEGIHNVILNELDVLLGLLETKTEEWKEIPMLAKTHGQPASPTILGKEIHVFVERLYKQLSLLEFIPFSAKFGGATGNFNAHHIAYQDINWVDFSNHFVDNILGLDRSQTTTQIEHYDNIAAIFDNFKRINTILLDFSKDMWAYISMEYFKQKIKEGEVGSSAMPHKVNPIDFENAEGNLGLANAYFEHLSAKLPISRLQRDLTDSTVFRNMGVPFAHTLIALKSLQKGMNKIILNNEALEKDLENNWAVVAEAIQTVLRSIGYPNPYEALKELTRTGNKIDKESIFNFIQGLEIPQEIKERLTKITPQNYTGIF